MANRWGKVETVNNFIFLGSQITVDGDCSQEIKRHWDDPEGWYGEGGGFRMGTHVYLWWIHFDIWQN